MQLCRYGKVCRTPNCPFVHPETPVNTALKWTAPSYTSGPKAALDILTKKLDDVSNLVKKREEMKMNEELNKLKEVTASLESSTPVEA